MYMNSLVTSRKNLDEMNSVKKNSYVISNGYHFSTDVYTLIKFQFSKLVQLTTYTKNYFIKLVNNSKTHGNFLTSIHTEEFH